MPVTATVPTYEHDIYSAAAIRDPLPHYARLRALGPVVWLAAHKVHALPRYPECKQDYLAPSLDTTISAISSAVDLLASHPDQWALLKADRSLVPNAVNEVVRLTSPVRAFSRKAVQDVEIAGHRIRSGERVLVLYASANRDEAVWPDPDRFDVTRPCSHQLGFGHGAHGCAGQGLARLEAQAVLQHLLDAVERIEPTGRPEWAVNNVIRSYRTVPVRLVPASPVPGEGRAR